MLIPERPEQARSSPSRPFFLAVPGRRPRPLITFLSPPLPFPYLFLTPTCPPSRGFGALQTIDTVNPMWATVSTAPEWTEQSRDER